MALGEADKEVLQIMKVLLDTNIIIHRETSRVLSRDVDSLFKWLDKGGYEKCVHPVTMEELAKNDDTLIDDLFGVKFDSYSQLTRNVPMHPKVCALSERIDESEKDRNDSALLNEVVCGRIDILISEDAEIHRKAVSLEIADKVLRIESFLERALAEHPEWVDYKVLSVQKRRFGEINLADAFFDSLKADYNGFEEWFNRKAEEFAYVSKYKETLLTFLFLKVETEHEPYPDITPPFVPKKRLKIGTFKVVASGFRLGERFLKIVFDNAIANKVEEIYVTIFDKTSEQKRLIALLTDWGFVKFGVKSGESGNELVYVRDMYPKFNVEDPKSTFPFFPRNARAFLAPIYPDYHTELLPDSILRTESPNDFVESLPHRNAISKSYISRSVERDLHRGDVIVFYRTGGFHKSVVSTIGIVEGVFTNIPDVASFIDICRKRSVFSDDDLIKHWDYNPHNRPFVVNFLCAYSFPKRPNLKWLIENGVIADISSAPRGFTRLTQQQFETILRGSQTDESLVVD